jgi:membrane-associated phospholipid phosphatase
LKLFLLIFLSITSLNLPQNKDTVVADITRVINTGEVLFTRPVFFDNQDILNLGIVLTAVTGAFLLDHEVKQFAFKISSDFNRHLFNIDRYYYVPAAAIFAVGIYSYGFTSGDEDFRKLGLSLGEAALYANTLNILLKFVSGRSRPLKTDDNLEFSPFRRAPIHSSFASAHTTLAFAISSVMSSRMDNIIWKAGWYTAAGLVGAARIYRQMHWFSDVIMGAAIGYYIGEYVSGNSDQISISFTPYGLGIKAGL